MAKEPLRPACVFLIPAVRDSDRKPHPPVLWSLQDALVKTFGVVTGPETVLYYRNPAAVPYGYLEGAKNPWKT